jgi:GNAT superfamily N-acetyltransferase
MSASPHESVRGATRADLDELVRLAAAAIEEKRAQKGGPVWSRREARHDPAASLAAALAADDHAVLVGLLDDAVVGYGVVHDEVLDDGGRLGVVEDVYVEPGAREVGLGELLMDHLVDWCARRGCFGVDSLALPGDRATKNFFESFGLVARAIVVHRRLQADDDPGDRAS